MDLRIDLTAFRAVAEGLAIGLLVGIERYRGREPGERKSAGVRTFAIIAVLGAVCGLFEAEMRVAAFQNGYFTALCNRVGREERLDFAGESFVCDPSGRVVARAPASEELTLHAELDLGEIAGSNARQLFLRDRRPELYSDWLR